MEKKVLPLLIEGLELMDREKYREAHARINNAVVLLATVVIEEVDIVDTTAQVLKRTGGSRKGRGE